jgi:tetratricopeptide (TPR) repeat protein
VRILVLGLLYALVAANAPAAAARPVGRTNVAAVHAPDPADPVEQEYEQLLELDDKVQQEVDRWIREEQAQREQGGGLSDATLRTRIRDRLEPVREAYEAFLRRHPEHARARLAYGSFLMDTGREDEAVAQMEKARAIDPKNPAAWNNLANYYGHRGPVRKAFEYYDKAIELNPDESVYYQNLATTVFLFRKDAMVFYKLDEPGVFERSLELYRKAIKLDPQNFVLASDYAQTFYGIKPPASADAQIREKTVQRLTDQAVAAWEHALKLAEDEEQREGVYLHLARVKLNAGRFDEARVHLNAVTNEVHQTLKKRLLRNLEEKQSKSAKARPADGEAGTP